jgi:hypothetical protein
VLRNPLLPATLKADLKAADTSPAGVQAADRTLAAIKSQFDDRAGKLAAKIERGVKEAFAASIATMFRDTWVVVILGIAVALFLPEVPLRHRVQPEEPTVASAA